MAETSETPARTQDYVERDRACMGPTARIPYYDLVVDHARGALLYEQCWMRAYLLKSSVISLLTGTEGRQKTE